MREQPQVDRQWRRPTLVVLSRADSEETLVTICKETLWPVAGPGSWKDNCRGISNCGMAGCATISAS